MEANLNSEDSYNVEDSFEKRFDAFVRRDSYGPMGCGKLGMKEKVLLCVALVTLAPIRVVLVTMILMMHGLICKMCTLFAAPVGKDGNQDYAGLGGWRRTVVATSGRIVGRLLLFVLGFYWIRETHHNFIAEVLANSFKIWYGMFLLITDLCY